MSALCVGAVSRRVIDVAAKLKVAQIVASRRQVDTTRSYTRMTQADLVVRVRLLSEGATRVVRDHGGPGQGWGGDDGVASFDADVVAGFDGLHIDVCRLPPNERLTTLKTLAQRYRECQHIEIGGEHDTWFHNVQLLRAAREVGARPSWVVAEAGTFVWAEHQRPVPQPFVPLFEQAVQAKALGVKLKAHNADFMLRSRSHVMELTDAYNLAPELATVELDALLAALSLKRGTWLLERGYASGEWRRWFNDNEGTWFERARCGARYILEEPDARSIVQLDANDE